VMTGDGGDEVLGVTPAYAADLLRSGEWRQLALLSRSLSRYWSGRTAQPLYHLLWTYGLRAVLRDWAWRTTPGLALRRRRQLMPRAIPSWVAPDPEVRRDIVTRYEENWARQISQGSFYRLELDTYAVHPLPLMIFEEQFYRSAAVGVPVLHPFWNRPVADLLLRTPPCLLNQRGEWKGLVRSRVAERFPRLGFGRQKKVITTAFPKMLLRSEGPSLWKGLGRAWALTGLGLVEPSGFKAMLSESLRSNDIVELYRLWHNGSTEAWARCRV
jgi:hypothetical protein